MFLFNMGIRMDRAKKAHNYFYKKKQKETNLKYNVKTKCKIKKQKKTNKKQTKNKQNTKNMNKTQKHKKTRKTTMQKKKEKPKKKKKTASRVKCMFLLFLRDVSNEMLKNHKICILLERVFYFYFFLTHSKNMKS